MTEPPAPQPLDSAEFPTGSNPEAWHASLEAAKLEALAEFAAGAGHEINNPLAIISGRVQMLLAEETDPERRQALLTIGGQAYRIRDMIGDLMLFARPPQPTPQALDLAEILPTLVKTMAETAARSSCRFEIDCPDSVPIWADRTQLNVAITALIQNSLDALAAGGTVRIQAATASRDNRQFAVFSVADNGPGFTDEQRQHLFDPFFSGRQAGRGLGFGLSKCWRIVLQHGGRIDVSSVPGLETRFQIHWPARPE